MRMCHVTGLAALAVTVFVASSATHAQTVSTDVHHDTSTALTSIPKAPAKPQAAYVKEHRVKRLPPLPAKPQAAGADKSLQKKAATKLAIGPIDAFEGIGEGMLGYSVDSFPADTTGAAGTTQYVQWVNTSLAVFDKTSKQPVLGPVDGSTLWKGFGGNCEHFNDGDPIVLFDRIDKRWILSQFAVGGSPFSQCVAVSANEDATGVYYRYEFQYQDFNDYGKLSVWPDAYYATYNMFGANDAFLGAKVCAFERTKMLQGQPAKTVCFDVSSQGGLLPSDLDGNTAPPAGSPNYVMNFGSDSLNLWKFKVDWNNPNSSSLTGPISIKTAPFDEACSASLSAGTCIKQPKTSVMLDSLSDRLMYRLAYRNLGVQQSLVVNHSVAVGARSGIRWYEVRDPDGTPVLQQQGTYSPTRTFRWMGSIATDKAGNIAVGYGASSGSVYPSIRLSGRSGGDPANRLSAEEIATIGEGSQRNATRWGDYSTLTVDPADDCSFWYTAQYQKDGTHAWHTKILLFKFQSCH